MHTCKFCNKQFESGQKLGGHIVIHNDSKILCDICRSEVNSRSFRSHKKSCQKLHDKSGSCEYCSKPISPTKRFCSSRCAASKMNSMNPERSEAVKLKISNSLKGRVVNPERYAARNCKNCNSPYTPSRPTLVAGYCSSPCRKESMKIILSNALKGKSGGPRKGGGRGKGGYYKDVWFDSSWEIMYAKFLDEKSVRWERVTSRFPYTFEEKEYKYIPDFYLPDENIFVEIKGYVTERDKAKWHYFPHTLRVIVKEDLIKLGIL
jgi:NAD-dependent dihydropyrimidine dehydrogenase PreA subunit